MKVRAFGTFLCFPCTKFLTSLLVKCQQLSAAGRNLAVRHNTSNTMFRMIAPTQHGRPVSAARGLRKEVYDYRSEIIISVGKAISRKHR